MKKYKVYYNYGGTHYWTDTIKADSFEIINNMVIFKKDNELVKMYSLYSFIYAEIV